MNTDSYRRHYTKRAFFLKTRKLTGRLLKQAILLYLILINKETPLYIKLLIVAVLGYLIAPIDAYPDCIPLLGYTDDFMMMATLLASLDGYITDEMRKKAKRYA